MIQNKIIKLRKYLFLISVLFFVLSLTHLIYTYIYNDSKLVPIKWWTVSEWLIWTFPSLNPLKPLTWNNQYIVWLLYRSLLKFDLKENKIVWDLATCDISNMLNVECYLKDNIFWSNWDPITADDVLTTYNVLKNTWVNKVVASLLEETVIQKHDNVIVFKNSKKDINFLNIFLQPILPKETLDTLWEEMIFWNFPTQWQIYSWIFKISNITSDLTIWITKIFLDVNQHFYKWNISKLVINLFPNTNSMLQNKETVNIFNDVDNIIGDSIPRLENHKYTLPQYASLFINENTVKDLSLRNHILDKINTENLVKLLWEDKFKTVKNPYLGKTSIDSKVANKNFEKIISDLWYIKKSKIIEKFLPTTSSNTWVINNTGTTNNTGTINTKKEEIVINKPAIVVTPKPATPIATSTENQTIDKFQADSKYIKSPVYVDKYNFITKEDILLEWIAGANVDEVYINDYKLSSFKKWSNNFYYRLKETFWTLKAWVNTYKIYFLEWWNKVLKEELTFIYYNDKNILDKEVVKFIQNLYANEQKLKDSQEKTIIEKPKVDITEQAKIEAEKNRIAAENAKIVAEKTKTEATKIEANKKRLEQLNKLDEKYYYNDKLEKYTLSLYYVSSEKALEDSAKFIKDSLLEIWIDVKLFPISLSDLRTVISEKDKYDMIITWVNLWLFDYNIFPYFHSSQVKNWYNFSNIKKTSLDILLEDLKSDIRTPEETNIIKEKVLDILKKEQIIKTLYTPKINLLIDKNIRNIIMPDVLINNSARKDIFNYLYIKENKIINFENKWIVNFFSFLFKKLND